MLNAGAQPYKPVGKRVKDARLSEHAPVYKPVNTSGTEAMPSEVAAPFQPVKSDEHSLFLTFSNGFPLSERQIFEFFNWSYAPDVERAIIPKPKGGRGPALHGRVVFKNTHIPNLVMGSREKVCLSIDGRPVYCRRFKSKQRKSAATASANLGDGGSHPGGDA